MKYLIVTLILLTGCDAFKQEPTMKFTPSHMDQYSSCLLEGPKYVYNVKLFGSQRYGKVNNFRLKKNRIEIKNLLPSLAQKFQGIEMGADVLAPSANNNDLIIDFEKLFSDRFPIVLEKEDKLEITFYEQEKPDDLNMYCEFYWDEHLVTTREVKSY